MAGATWDGSELNSLAATFERSGGQVGARAAIAVRKTAFDVEADGKAFVPVDTGNLRNSISSSFTGSGSLGGIEAEIGPTAEYGRFVENGTSRMAPHAFMGPALDRHSGAFVQAIDQAVAESL